MTVPSGLSLQALRGPDVISSAPSVMKSASVASEPAETVSSTRSWPVSDKAGRNLKLRAVQNRT